MWTIYIAALLRLEPCSLLRAARSPNAKAVHVFTVNLTVARSTKARFCRRCLTVLAA